RCDWYLRARAAATAGWRRMARRTRCLEAGRRESGRPISPRVRSRRQSGDHLRRAGKRPNLILLDANILLRYARATDPAFATVDTAINTLHASGETLCIVPQNVYEFWATATRPIASNGLGLSVTECQIQVARLKRLFRLVLDLPN